MGNIAIARGFTLFYHSPPHAHPHLRGVGWAMPTDVRQTSWSSPLFENRSTKVALGCCSLLVILCISTVHGRHSPIGWLALYGGPCCAFLMFLVMAAYIPSDEALKRVRPAYFAWWTVSAVIRFVLIFFDFSQVSQPTSSLAGSVLIACGTVDLSVHICTLLLLHESSTASPWGITRIASTCMGVSHILCVCALSYHQSELVAAAAASGKSLPPPMIYPRGSTFGASVLFGLGQVFASLLTQRTRFYISHATGGQ